MDETERLRSNLFDQKSRLLHQLADLEELKTEIEEEEYTECKSATIEELCHVEDSLTKISSGHISLSNQHSIHMQMTREAVSNAFKTPEVIRMFARREPDQLRLHYDQLKRDFKLGKITSEQWINHRRELLLALQQLGEKLLSDDEEFLKTFNNSSTVEFEKVERNNPTDDILSKALNWAKDTK